MSYLPRAALIVTHGNPSISKIWLSRDCLFVRRPRPILGGKYCGAASVGVLQDNLVLSTELIM